jgi:tetratricopeptide (TPR) repeat protein
MYELKPDHASAYYNKCIVLNVLGRKEEAIAACDKAIKLEPDYAYAYYNKGWYLYTLGKYQESVTALNRQ